eukprot:SAG11_NODE_3273_length_2561_cov_1.925670_1_plen_58_part_10
MLPDLDALLLDNQATLGSRLPPPPSRESMAQDGAEPEADEPVGEAADLPAAAQSGRAA